MNNSLRPAPGPRDWTPSGSDCGAYDNRPGTLSYSYQSPQPYRALRRRITWAGYLSVALGLVSIASIVRPEVEPTRLGWAIALSGPAALTVGGFALGRWARIPFFERFMALIGIMLGIIATLSLLAALSTLSSNIPANPLVGAPLAPTTVDSANPEDLSVDDQVSRGQLAQIAGTAVYLIGLEIDNTGSLPQTIQLENGRLVVGQKGSNIVAMDVAAVEYALNADGINYLLTLTDTFGTVAYYDSTVGFIQYG